MTVQRPDFDAARLFPDDLARANPPNEGFAFSFAVA
jgi:hypothetical protein